ncbi:conjugal transfer protein TrbB [Agrobacterium tumefaciens]|nr:conjugal transfer protein TrbB [Agrobacterium tumefaciens]
MATNLCIALDDATVVEIMLNPDGRLFIERLGHGVAPAGAMGTAAAEVVIGSVAHALQSEADDERPIISGELPIGGHRFEGYCHRWSPHQHSRSAVVPRVSFH